MEMQTVGQVLESDQALRCPIDIGLHRLPMAMRPDPDWSRAEPQLPRLPSLMAAGLHAVLQALSRGERPWPLYLYGDVGTGKTCAALCLLDFVRPLRLYCTTDRLITWYLERGEDPHCYANLLRTANLLVVDELGTRSKTTDLEYCAVKFAADARLPKRPAIWISNHAPGEIKTLYDARIESRILSGTWCKITGTDRRME